MKNIELTNSLVIVVAASAMVMIAGCEKPPEPAGQQPEAQEASAMVETIAEYFSPQGTEVTAATYPTAESARQSSFHGVTVFFAIVCSLAITAACWSVMTKLPATVFCQSQPVRRIF